MRYENFLMKRYVLCLFLLKTYVFALQVQRDDRDKGYSICRRRNTMPLSTQDIEITAPLAYFQGITNVP